MKHAIYGTLELQNGVTINWLRFIEKTFSRADAEKEAARIVIAEAATPKYRDSIVKKCTVTA